MSASGQTDLPDAKPRRASIDGGETDRSATVSVAQSVAASTDVKNQLFEGEDAIPSETIPSSEAYTLLRGNGHHRDRPLELVLRWLRRPSTDSHEDESKPGAASRHKPQ